MHWTIRFTEVFYLNETAEFNKENSTLGKGEEVAVEHCDDTVTTDNTTNGSDSSFNITDRTNSTNQQIMKYVVKQNKTESQEKNTSAHYKNALKRKRRASSGIFDPHPALATLPLHIIADDDFYPVADDTVLATPKPTIKENLKATAPQVFPLFTPLPVLPPGYLERYNVSTEVQHPVVSKKVESDKNKISKSNTNSKSLPQSHYRDEKYDDANVKPRSNNLKSNDFNLKKYNSELEEYERPYKEANKNYGENYKSANNDKKNKEHNKNEESNTRDKIEKDYEPHTYRQSNLNSKPQSYDFAPKHDPINKFRPRHDSRYFNEEKQRDEENHYENENQKPQNSKHNSIDKLNNEERYYNDEIQRSNTHKSSPLEENYYENENKTPRYTSDEKQRSVTHKSSPSEENQYENENKTPENSKHTANENVNKETYYSDKKESSVDPTSSPSDYIHEKNSHYQDEKKTQHQIHGDGNDEDKNGEEDDFRHSVNNLNVKNDVIEPRFRPKGYTNSGQPQKINKEDSVEDYDEQPYNDGFVHEYTPIINKNPETYKNYNTQDNSSDNRENPELYYINSGPSTEASDEIEKVPFNRQSDQKKAEENIELRSNKFISKNMGDNGSSANDEEINNEDDRSDEDEEHYSRPSSHYKNDKSNYQNVNIYSKPSVSSEDTYNEEEYKKESESLPDDNNSQESDRVHPKHRSSDSSENEKSYHSSQPQLQKYSDHVEDNAENSTELTSYDDYTPSRESIEHLRKSQDEGSEEIFNHDHSQENTSQELNKPQGIYDKLSKNKPREESDENVSSEENNTQLSKPYDINPDDAPVENNSHDTGSKEKFQEHELSRKPKLLYENYQTHDYPSRTPSGFSKGNIGLSDENSKTTYGTYNQLATHDKDHTNEQAEFMDGNHSGNKRAKISYETFHPSIQEYPKRVPTGFSKDNTDNVNAKISYETYHPQVTGSSEENRDYGNVKPTLSYETYHPSPGSTEYQKPSQKEASNENIDNNDSFKKPYKTYHPQRNTEKYSQKISAAPEHEFNQASIPSTINPKISYETYHPFVIANPEPLLKNSQPEVISNQPNEQETGNVRPTQYFEIYSQSHTPTKALYNDDSQHPPDKTTYISKEAQGKPPKKYEPKKIFNDYNKFNPYKNLYPDAFKKVPKLPIFYSKKHSELPGLTTTDSSGNVKQQFERIPLDYMHDSQKSRTPKLSNNLSYISSEERDENLSSKENEEYTRSNEQSDKYKPDLEIKLDDIKLDLPEIKLPESVLLYDSEENDESEGNGDKKENYQVKEDDENGEETEEEEEDGPARLPEEDDDSRKYEDNQQPDDDLYGKFFNDNIDLYESFVQDHFNKKGTFAERSQQIIDDPVLKSTMQNVLKRVSKSTKEAEKSKDPKYGYMWTLNYGRPL